ncbi:uncharacterized protein LOC129593144 isoform X2 [Paramacrobiotus metropolitanus]|uniref:uncharacterized protein LOC129593144 isoform X2 n=1 Tax=Paramacrobiotus metropolitanus TaxID=2943436 RepID=UPI00244626C5|nr:uncharacterized protein LOC129593144 isoform X2 [Paramacrobiotus metropolitanus]
MSAAILSMPPLKSTPGCRARDDTMHAKKPSFRWLAPSKKDKQDANGELHGKSEGNPPGASDRLDLALPATSAPRPAGTAPRRPSLQRAQSLRERDPDALESRLPLAELKSILKRSRCLSECPVEPRDVREASPDEFWYEFRSVEELYEDGWRKRVSFSEKITLNSFRPGTCILQQKQKAQRKREKRQNKERRRTASESDAAEIADLTNTMSDLRAARHNDSDSGLETDGSPTLEDVAETEEEVWDESAATDAPLSKSKKKRNRRNRKGKSE